MTKKVLIADLRHRITARISDCDAQLSLLISDELRDQLLARSDAFTEVLSILQDYD